MMTRMTRLPLAWLCVSVALLTTTAVAASTDSVIILTPEFESVEEMTGSGEAFGRNAAALLNLQLWRQLKIPRDHEGNLTQSRGALLWIDSSKEATSHVSAENAARWNLAQMTFWGSAFPYGDGAIIQAYLSLPRYHDFRRDHNEMWSLTVAGTPISVDMPRRRYDFAPIQVDTATIERYSNPFALEVCAGPGPPPGMPPCNRNSLQGGFQARQHESDCSLVATLGGRELGWICGGLPSRNTSEVVDFVSGIARVMRADWTGAVESFEVVLNTEQAPVRLQIDARLFIAMSLHKGALNGTIRSTDEMARRVGPPRELIEQALAINPADETIFKYLVMSLLSDVNVALKAGKQPDFSEIKQQLAQHRRLLSSADPWLRSLEKIIE